MMSARETTTRGEEEGAKEEKGREEWAVGLAGAAFEGSTHDRFATSCAALHRIDSLLMAPII